MKHIKKHIKKINKTPIKKWWVLLIIVFFAMVILFQKDTKNTEIQFVRNSDEVSVHNAANANAPASQRDYLFQDEAGNSVYQWPITKWTANAQIIDTPLPKENMDNLIDVNGSSEIKDTTGNIYTGTLNGGTGNTIQKDQVTKNDITDTQSTNTSTNKTNCITPRNEEVNNHDFVLGYQQRDDVNTMCNIEKRVCLDGILWGTFKQSSCKENMVYEYRKAEVISYNQKVLNEYIQPSAPANAGAEFTTQGKIDTTKKPIDTWGTSNNPIMNKPVTTETPLPNKESCFTPRGQEIKHGQFVKAYKAPRGFLDLACDVEIRACINGNLKGTFNYSKCTFNNTSYAEYIKAGSPKASSGFLFFQWIKTAFRR